jgi:hypothetical protein
MRLAGSFCHKCGHQFGPEDRVLFDESGDAYHDRCLKKIEPETLHLEDKK